MRKPNERGETRCIGRRIFVAETERIPPLETKVVVIVTPIMEAKKEKK